MAAKCEFTLRRSVRTTAGENYVIFAQIGKDESVNVGNFDLHISGNIYYGTLVLTSRLKKRDFEGLLEQIDDQLIGVGREDFIFSVFQGKEVGFYSDTVSEKERKYHSATKADIEDVHDALRKVLGRHQGAKAQLSEHAVCSYFESLGYKARRSGPELDAKKIDVVAENENEVIYAQVKLGSISEQEMVAVVKSASALSKSESRDTLVAIVAGRYPVRSEFIRARLEQKYGVRILCISATDVIESNPEYRRTLGGNA